MWVQWVGFCLKWMVLWSLKFSEQPMWKQFLCRQIHRFGPLTSHWVHGIPCNDKWRQCRKQKFSIFFLFCSDNNENTILAYRQNAHLQINAKKYRKTFFFVQLRNATGLLRNIYLWYAYYDFELLAFFTFSDYHELLSDQNKIHFHRLFHLIHLGNIVEKLPTSIIYTFNKAKWNAIFRTSWLPTAYY